MAEDHDYEDETPTNGYPKEKVNGFVAEIETHLDEIEGLQIEYMNDCRKVREQITAIYKEAKEQGLPKKELRKVVKVRELERRADKVREDLEPDEQDRFDLLRHALGDLDDDSIREAAMARAKRKQEGDSAVDSLGAE